MSLESIFRVVSNALKSAHEVNSGTPEEKAALDVLGGLSAMLEVRVQLHKHASPASLNSETHAASKPQPVPGPRTQTGPAPAASHAGLQKRAQSAAGDSYDLK